MWSHVRCPIARCDVIAAYGYHELVTFTTEKTPVVRFMHSIPSIPRYRVIGSKRDYRLALAFHPCALFTSLIAIPIFIYLPAASNLKSNHIVIVQRSSLTHMPPPSHLLLKRIMPPMQLSIRNSEEESKEGNSPTPPQPPPNSPQQQNELRTVHPC